MILTIWIGKAIKFCGDYDIWEEQNTLYLFGEFEDETFVDFYVGY